MIRRGLRVIAEPPFTLIDRTCFTYNVGDTYATETLAVATTYHRSGATPSCRGPACQASHLTSSRRVGHSPPLTVSKWLRSKQAGHTKGEAPLPLYQRQGDPSMSEDRTALPPRSSSTQLTIGDVVIPVPDFAVHPEWVAWETPGVDQTASYLQPSLGSPTSAESHGDDLPSLSGDVAASENIFFSLRDPLTRSYLRWMAQKEQLGQDMCLLGDPGPAMRWLVMLYSHLTRREIRVVYLNSDITESDLKQRREIRNGSLVYDDQSAVAAAVEGQLLVLEGLERVERNVLPVINNLLENREMHLDNGSVLIHPARYDSLLQKLYTSKLQSWQQQQRSGDARGGAKRAALIAEAKQELSQMGLLRVSERFRVIGITVPVPPYEGNPLDPPLRSRFQCLYVKTPLPVMSSSSSILATLGSSLGSSLAVGREDAKSYKRSKVVLELQERQSKRFAQVVQLRAAITAINDATRDFQLSGPKRSTATPPATRQSRYHYHHRGSNQNVTAYANGDAVVERLYEDGDAATDSNENASVSSDGCEAAVATNSPLQIVGHWALATIGQQLALFPDIPVGEAVVRGFPWPYYARQLTRSGGGGVATGYANVEEYHRCMAQYAEVLHRCHIYPPLLLLATTTAARGSRAAGAEITKQRSRHRQALLGEPAAKAPRMSDRLRAVVQGRDVEAVSEEAHDAAGARRYVRSAQLVSAEESASPIPLPVQQICNYILQLRPMTSTATFSGVPVVVGEAVVATAAYDATQPGQPGTYTLKIFMGIEALPSPTVNADQHTARDAARAEPRSVASYLYTTAAPSTVFTTEHYHILQTMLQVHASRQHLCLLGPTGCGKTAMVRAFGRLLGYPSMSTMHLYADMTHKDLFQQRRTDPKTGNTTWQASALLHAAIYGELVVLDGMDKLPSGMLASLQQLLVDQSAVLADGTILRPPKDYELLKEKLTRRDSYTGEVLWRPSDDDMRDRAIFPVHPCFRVVATARPPMPLSSGGGGGTGGSSRRDFFITPDLTTLFRIVAMPEAGEDALGPVLRQVAQTEAHTVQSESWRGNGAATSTGQRYRDEVVEKLLRLRNELDELHSMDSKMPQLSLRQLRQLVRSAVRYPSQLEASVRNTLLLPLLTGVAATKVQHALHVCGLTGFVGPSSIHTSGAAGASTATAPDTNEMLSCAVLPPLPTTTTSLPPNVTRLWSVNGEPVLQLSRAYTQKELALVPFVTGFHINPVHESMLAWLAKQYAMGSNILLIGHQGVGKNKVVDAFLSRLGIPRHYVQLHRDTTVGSLTINPTVEAGKVVWEDSPLVKAVQQGHCLVVDEIDKAPVEVVQVLKGLIEDREMRLGDGRLICDPTQAPPVVATRGAPASTSQCIAIHPDFHIIVLANPPGFPFHGNDFFRECGDLFAAYVMGNPDADSQLRVLTAYAPNLPRPLLESLVLVFLELQSAFTQGHLTYPFSLRELIAVVKHMARFPQDGVYGALNNVFNFDACDDNALRLVRRALAHFLQPMLQHGGFQRLKPYRAGHPTPLQPLEELVPLPGSAVASVNRATSATLTTADQFASLLPLPATVDWDQSQVVATVLATAAEGSREAASGPPPSRQQSQQPHSVSLNAPDATDASKWHVTYPTEAFFPPAFSPSSSPSSATEWTGAFTEWTGHSMLPFVDPSTDRILSMTAVGGQAEREAETPPLLSVLLLRQRTASSASAAVPREEEKSPRAGRFVAPLHRLLVVTVRLPALSSSFDPRGLITDTALWPVGHARFVDVTTHYAAELATASAAVGAATSADEVLPFVFTSLCMASHHVPWCWGADGERDTPASASSSSSPSTRSRVVWPPSLAMFSAPVQGACLLHPSGLAADAAPQAILLLSSKLTGLSVLIDVLAGASPDLFMSPQTSESITATAAAASGTPSRTTEALGAVLPLPLPRFIRSPTASNDGTSKVRILDVSASNGTVCFASAASSSPECCLLQQGCIVKVTLPQPVQSLRFVGNGMAFVQLNAVGSEEGRLGSSLPTAPPPRRGGGGILKVAVTAGNAAEATFLPLVPDADHLELVETKGRAGDSDATAVGSGVLVPVDLEGSIWQVRGGPASAGASTHGSEASRLSTDDVVYARVEGTSARGLQLRHYRIGMNTAVPVRNNVLIDVARHQLLQIPTDGTAVTAIDTQHGTQRTFASLSAVIGAATPLPTTPTAAAATDRWTVDSRNGAVFAWDGAAQRLSVADIDVDRLRQRYSEWTSLLSGNPATVGDAATVEDGAEAVKEFPMTYSKPHKQPSGTLKHGEVDDKEHHGGNTWAGGTGGTDTAGLGGLVGPYRLDKGNTVHQVSSEEKRKVPRHLLEEARKMGREALKERLQSIGMTEEEYEQYQSLRERVRPAVAQLRSLLMGLKAAEGERVWVTGQTDGVWDDKKLVEGIVGERNLYKRRVNSKEASPFQQKYKKRLVFVLDVSASMYRFNGTDQRLTKLLETTIMIMEAFAGFESKLDYAMIGHNGDSDHIPLVNFGVPPANQKERMIVCQKMLAYAQYCWSGDNTVEAMRQSIELVTKEKGDAYFVFVISDANLRQYGITPRELTEIILSKPEVKMFCIFIATLGAQASHLQQQLPAGHGYECMRTDVLPQVLRQIFTSANLF